MTTRLLIGAVLVLCAASFTAEAAQAPILTRATVDVSTPSEILATLTAQCQQCDWAVKGRETVMLEVRVDGQYSQHVALMRGRDPSDYQLMLGSMAPGRHEVTIEAAIAERARAAVQRMIDMPPPSTPARYDLVKARHHVDIELI